ncbi:polysaccharide lyase family 7 protein [Flammeovirga sp. SubArs3]|uniref:polysaccharide lyase family 7 protein n=1 Tax=Flammeovirga sp. SubArs3 TaxID=2995316 RepID=UPI00248AFD93|nr:polysaccharide lyase family 7 protein [Flammeovirga sp. SubArs3]
MKYFLLLFLLWQSQVFAQKPVLILNSGFEDGLKNWEVKGKVQKSQDTQQGVGAAKLAEKGATISQFIRVTPKTDYKLTVSVKGKATVFVSVKGKKTEVTTNNKKYASTEITFNSGKAKNIIIGAEYLSEQSRLDDFKIIATSTSEESQTFNPIIVVNSGFESKFNFWESTGEVSASNVVNSGVKSAKMDGKAELRQKVKIYPSQTYRLDVAVKGRGQIFAEVKGEEVTKDFDTKEFEVVSLEFSASAKGKYVTIGGRYTEKQVRFDDFKVTLLNQEIDPNHQFPSDVIPSLTDWKVTLPIDGQGRDNQKQFDVETRIKNPLEIADGAIVDFEYKPYFYAKNGEVFFRAHCAGVTTKGSKYPRSELRQRSGYGNLYWSMDLPQYLETELRVTSVPVYKPEVCITQIHGPDDEPLRVQYHTRKGVYIVWNENNKDYDNAVPYKLGEQLKITVSVDKGYITCHIQNLDQNKEYKKIWKSMDKTGYFKVGCYTQASKFQSQIKSGARDEPKNSYGEVAVKSIVLKTTYSPSK